jgi:Spherulation-specific family 4
MKSRFFHRSSRVLVCVTLMASANAVASRVTQAAPLVPTISQKVAVPSYINPLLDPNAWFTLATANPASVGFVVANVINGPDYVPLPEWTTVINGVAAGGGKVVGYVDTGYFGTTGQRTRLGSTDPIDWMSQIQHDVAAWYKFYGDSLSGIFFDQMQNACGWTEGNNDWADLYRHASDEVKRLHPGALTVLNPGIGVPQCYEDAGDVIVTFEGSYASYIGDPTAANPFVPLSWTPVDPNKIWHIVYGAPDTAAMANAIALSKTRSSGYVFVTNDVLANPYDTLPPADYWAAELASVITLPGATRPPSPPVYLDTVEVSGTTIDLDWTSSRSRTAVVAYDIYRDGVLIGSVPGTTTTYRAVDLLPMTTYVFTVVARDAFGVTSSPSVPLPVTTDESYGSPRKAPTSLAPSETTFTSTRLSWQTAKERVRKDRPEVAETVVLQNGREILRLPGWVTTVTVGGLAPASTYAFSVYNIDGSGERSKDAVAISVTTPELPGGATIGATSIVESPEQFVYSADFFVPVAFRRVFIATGNPANLCWSTGSTPQICTDYIIENERLLRYTGTGLNWDWAIVADVVPTVVGTTYTWTIAPASIGSPVTAAAVFNANGYAPNAYCGVNFACATSGPPLPYE